MSKIALFSSLFLILSLPQAISQPTEENEEKAWTAILPAVDQLKEFYDYSSELSSQVLFFLFYFIFFKIIICSFFYYVMVGVGGGWCH